MPVENKILIASNDPNAKNELTELFRGLTDVQVSAASNGDDALRKIRDLDPGLILLDVSLPGISGYDICKLIKQSDQTWTPVILFSVRGKLIDEGKVRLCQADSTLMVPFESAPKTRYKLIRYLHKPGPESIQRRMTQDTRVTLDLMTHRASSIIYSELGQNLLPEQIASLAQIDSTEAATSLIANSFDSLTGNPIFMLVVARRLLEELPGLMWTELTERLIDTWAYELNDFGKFQRNYSALGPSVDFLSDSVLAVKKIPHMDYVAQSDTLAAINACREGLKPSLLQLSEQGGEAAQFLSRALPEVLAWFNTEPSLIALDTAAPQGGVETRRRHDWLSLRARAASYAAFYTHLVACANVLHSGHVLEIQTIGSISLNKGKIDFRVSPQLLALLEANPLSMSARSA